MFTVTRQRQWGGIDIVEISAGGIDYTNPDALGAKYSGEFQEYSNPIEAVQTAIEIARQWRKDSGKRIDRCRRNAWEYYAFRAYRPKRCARMGKGYMV